MSDKSERILEAFNKLLESEDIDPSKLARDTGLEYGGTKITLPDTPSKMSIPNAVVVLNKIYRDEEQVVAVSEHLDAFPWDGAYVTMMAMREIFGWPEGVNVPGGFFSPDQPPASITVDTDYNESTQIMWGRFKIAQFSDEEYLEFGGAMVHGRHVFTLRGKIRKKNRAHVANLMKRAKQLLKTDSIYRGKAIILPLDGEDNIDYSEYPRFINTSAVTPDDLIYSRSTLEQIQTNLFTPIRHTAMCRKSGIPIKRGVLLEGPYGTGKTMLGTALANTCRSNGWTFILVPRVGALHQALEFAAMYAPAVVFSEDIDRVISGAERTVSMDDILNTIDGVTSKGSEIVTVLTTNHVEKINKAMMRPGRLDAVISLGPPDAEAVAKLIRLYACDSITKDDDVSEAAETMASTGMKPAVIREVVERAKLHAIGLSGGKSSKINGQALRVSADTMKHHFALMEDKDEVLRPADVLYNALQEMMHNDLPKKAVVVEIANQVNRIASNF